MTTLVITRGLPGSGKSTWARKWVAEDPGHRAEVNRDALRLMMHGGYADAERMVTTARDAAIRELLKQGVSVVSSDTNLPQRTARELASIARRTGASIDVKDLTNVSLETCIERDSYRSAALGDDKNPVGEPVIRRMHERYVAGKGYPLPLPAEDSATGAPDLVQFTPGLPDALIVDIDGTVALKGARGPFDESRVHEDRPNLPVIEVTLAVLEYLLQGQHDKTPELIFMSGRTDTCETATRAWLDRHIGVPFELHMRRAGDFRKDAVVKRELFDKHIRGRYNVLCVLDDRDQVVRMWREELGLTCLQAAPGNF